ncbi:GNAT family N-acetyltransferase [Butyrivibrio sp. AE3006]|uniref:GNAT family N-acetyltransferase n=1 Tax=Butyrivibrio sp. AE3006 TaxID=1280673 RepID=UPI0006854EBE|nr:GNAT family N-acetyltransferase [Butyrivibrio sp. AE3006]
MIETKKLRLVPFSMDHLEAYFTGFDSDITKYQYPEPFDSIEDAKEFLQGFIDEMNNKEMLCMSILDMDENYVGSVEVHGLNEDVPEIGIWIIKDQQRKGYAYEALSAVLDYTCKEYKKNRFFYEADVRNTGSQELLRKFKHEDKGVDKFTTESGKYLELMGSIVEI